MSDRVRTSAKGAVEWPTVGLTFVCYVMLGLALWVLPVWIAILVLGPTIALHASLTHEVVHGHPFQSRLANAALVFPALTLTVPFARFRATHLAHHRDEMLTDPYDDPETNYLDPAVWQRLKTPMRMVLRFNNSLAGRLLIGPLLGQVMWMLSDFRACKAGDRAVVFGWLAHIPALGVIVALVWIAPLPFWAYFVGTYLGHSILRIRTFLEHRAHELARARTVIVEDNGVLALLFLNNNLHVVHHMHPNVAWYDLPSLYAQNKTHYLRRNEGYVFSSYRDVFQRHFWRVKDKVAHPIWRSRG